VLVGEDTGHGQDGIDGGAARGIDREEGGDKLVEIGGEAGGKRGVATRANTLVKTLHGSGIEGAVERYHFIKNNPYGALYGDTDNEKKHVIRIQQTKGPDVTFCTIRSVLPHFWR
jgi:hypothetical protein